MSNEEALQRKMEAQSILHRARAEELRGKVKVAITVTLEVDAEGWNMDYGCGTGAAAIRQDVKGAVNSLLNEYNDSMTVVKFQ